MEYRNYNHATGGDKSSNGTKRLPPPPASKRDEFDSEVRKKYGSDYKKAGTENTSVPATNTEKFKVNLPKNWDTLNLSERTIWMVENVAPTEWGKLSLGERAKITSSPKTAVRNPTLFIDLQETAERINISTLPALKKRQDEEDRKREEARKSGAKYIPNAYIMSGWYTSTISVSENKIKKLKTDIEEKEKEVTLLRAVRKDIQSRYAVTGAEADRVALDRANQRYTDAHTNYIGAITEYNNEVNKHNTTIEEFEAYKKKEDEALGRAVRTDRGEIEKELESAEATLKLYEEQYKKAKPMYDRWMENKPWENEGMTYEEWLEHAEWVVQNPERVTREEDIDAAAYWWGMYGSVSNSLNMQQQKVQSLKTELELFYVRQPDFQAKSTYFPRKIDGIGIGDKNGESAYEFINGNREVRRAVLNWQNNLQAMDYYDAVNLFAERGWEAEVLTKINERERGIFNYIHETQGQEKAYEYIDLIYGDIQMRRYEQKEKEWEKHAEKYPFLADVDSVILKLNPKPAISNITNMLVRGEIDEYATYNDSVNKSNAIRSKRIENLGNVGGTIYGIGMSMADVVATILVSKGMGKLIGMSSGASTASSKMLSQTITPKLSQALMGSRVAADSMVEAKKRGFTDGEAFSFGLVSAAVEILTEKLPIDAFLDVETLKNSGWSYIRNSALSEMGEEAASNVLNTISEIVIAGDKSEWMSSIKQYKKEGYNEEDAFAKAFREQALSFGIDAIGGLLSGGLFATGAVGINAGAKAIQSGIENRRTLTDAVTGQYEAQKIARENAEGKKIVPMAAQNTAEGFVLPTAKETMAAQGNGANANNTAMESMTDAEYDAQMNVMDAEASMAGQSMLYDDGRQYALVGKTEDGRKIYKTNYPKGTPKAVKQNDIVQMVQNIWSKQPIELTIVNDETGATETITANFDPELSERSDLAKIVYGLKRGTAGEKRMTLDLGPDLYQIAQDGVHTGGKTETGKDNPAHDGVKRWEYFVTNLVYEDENGVQTDAYMNIDVKMKDDGGYFYSFTIEKGTAPQKIRSAVSETTSPTVPNNSISQNASFSQENSAQNPSGENVLPTAKELDRQRRAAKAETETERTGILLGVPEKIIRTVQRLAKIIGKEVVFYRNTDGKVKNDLGYYNHNDGKIYLNADAENPAAIILGHEMVHAIQLTDGYISFFKTVLRKMQADGINLSEARAELKAEYAKAKVELKTTAQIDQELVARYAQEHLFTDEASIASIVNADKESGHKILNFLDRILAKLGNKDARERVFIQKARALYAKALRESNGEGQAGNHHSETMPAKTGEATKPTEGHVLPTAKDLMAQRGNANPNATALDSMTDAEYDAQMDIEEAEASMAGQSMLYDDGRQFMISDEENVAESKRTWYNESDEMTGGEEHGRKMVDDRNRRVSSEHSGEQTEESLRGYGTPKDGIYREGNSERNGGKNVHYQDNEGRRITSETAEKIRETMVVDKDGRPMAVYHFTPNMEFETFAKGDIGFHFGTQAQATKRGRDIGAEQGRRFRVYLAIKNPIRIGMDIGNWHANAAALRLWSDGILTDVERQEIESLWDGERQYDSPAATRLREILEEKGYDGVFYANGFEGDGDSYIAFHDEQIIKTDIESVNPENSAEASTDGRQYAIAKDDADMAGTETKASNAENLPTKAATALRQTEQRLLESIGETLGVPKRAQAEFLQSAVREISEDYLESGKINREKVGALFDAAYEQGIVVNAEYYEQYKHIRDHLRNTKISISAEDGSSIADFSDFRKRAFGKLRIVNEGGLPVDAAYTELTDMAPELFPEDITHPADQLQQMYEVADGIKRTEQTLDEAYGDGAESFREMAKDEFHAAINSAAVDLQRVRRLAEDKARIAEEKAAEGAEAIQNREQLDEAYKNLKSARRNADKAKRRALLTEADELRVGQLLRGEISPMMLDPEKDNVKDILAIYKAKKEYETYAKRIREYNQKRKEGLREKAQEYLGNIQKWKDKTVFGGLRYSTETMERNFQDVMGEDADAIIEEYLKPVHKATASSTALKNEMRGRVEELNLSRKVEKGNTVSEAHAVQLLGEAEDHINVLKVMGPDATRDGKTLLEWQTILGKLWKENPNLDEGKIRKAAAEFREIYDELFEMMNDTRVRNGYEPVNYRRGYFPHFQPGDEGVLAQFGRALGIDTAVSALPTTINGMTHVFRPGIQWLGNAQERIGFNTVYDAVEGFDKYIEGVADVIYMTDSIQKLRALAREIRYEASDEGIKKQVDKIEAREDLTREEKDALIQAIYEKGKFALGNFVVELDEYTNLLANKKSRGDREMERKLGRAWYNIMRRVNSNVAANMTALNIPSWLTNFIPLTQAWGLTDSRYMLLGMAETIRAYTNGDDFVSRSTFLTNRRGSDPIIKAWEQGEEAKTIFGKAWRGYQAGIGKLSGGMEFIDQFTADSIVRAKYYQNIDAGMSEEAAMDDADAFAAGVMADRSKGGMPTIFHETNPIKKLFTQFQIEVNNQYRYLFKDMPREMQGKGAVAMAAAFLKVFLGAWMFNELYELLFGRRAAFDPAGIIKEVTEDAKGENGLWNGAVSLAKNVSEELPFIGGLLGGGRVPISSALPDVQNLSKALLYDGWDGKKRLATAAKEVGKPLFYTMLPGGGGQIKKVVEGIGATARGGSYTMDADGNDVLQYPVYNDTPAQAIGNGLWATIFGKSTLPTAKDWVDSGFKSLSAKDTEIYRMLLGAGVQGKDAFPAVQAVRDAKGSNDKRDAIRASGLPEEAKKILYRSKVSDKWDEEIAALEGAGITFDEFLQIQNQYTSAGEAKDDDEATAVTFARWLNTTPYSEEQKAVIKETFRASAGNYDKFVAAGLNDEKAAKLTARLEGLKPEEGKEKVSNVQKYKVIVTAGLPEKDQMAALSAVMSDGDYAKVQVGHTYSVTPVMYVTFKERLGEYDEDGNGSMNQKEVTNAIRNMSGGMNLPRHDGTSFNLTNKQKAVLWQLANKSWKAKNNPFDTSVGLQVYNALHAE